MPLLLYVNCVAIGLLIGTIRHIKETADSQRLWNVNTYKRPICTEMYSLQNKPIVLRTTAGVLWSNAMNIGQTCAVYCRGPLCLLITDENRVTEQIYRSPLPCSGTMRPCVSLVYRSAAVIAKCSRFADAFARWTRSKLSSVWRVEQPLELNNRIPTSDQTQPSFNLNIQTSHYWNYKLIEAVQTNLSSMIFQRKQNSVKNTAKLHFSS